MTLSLPTCASMRLQSLLLHRVTPCHLRVSPALATMPRSLPWSLLPGALNRLRLAPMHTNAPTCVQLTQRAPLAQTSSHQFMSTLSRHKTDGQQTRTSIASQRINSSNRLGGRSLALDLAATRARSNPSRRSFSTNAAARDDESTQNPNTRASDVTRTGSPASSLSRSAVADRIHALRQEISQVKSQQNAMRNPITGKLTPVGFRSYLMRMFASMEIILMLAAIGMIGTLIYQTVRWDRLLERLAITRRNMRNKWTHRKSDLQSAQDKTAASQNSTSSQRDGSIDASPRDAAAAASTNQQQ